MKKHRLVLAKRLGLRFGVILLTILSSQVALADYINDDCREDNIIFDQTQLQVGTFGDDGSCYASINSNPNFILKYRNYFVTNSGLFMVFNSYGNGPESTMTGAREFYFPSQLKKQMIITHNNGVLRVVLSNKITMDFSTKDGQPIRISNLDFKIDPSVNPKNLGGLEILNSSVVFVDGGFALGRSPTSIDKGKIFIKKQNRSCEKLVRDLFDNSTGDALLRYKNEEFDAFVTNKCPNI